MGSRPSFCRHCKKFLTSAIIKWWFSTSRGLRKMTTWHCYKMKIGFYHQGDLKGTLHHYTMKIVFLSSGCLKGTLRHYKMKICFYYQVTWRGHSTTTKWRLVFIIRFIRLLEGNTPSLQNDDWKGLDVYLWKGLSTTETLKSYLKCNSQTVSTKCRAQPHFETLFLPRK